MTSSNIRQRFIDFFTKRGHAFLPSASLVPKNDPTVLFNTAGMQPLVPYLMGRPHPLGNRLVSAQKCVRTGDIDEVGNHKNLTFFEMLGNWSLGDYFKEDAIKWSYEFLTSKKEGLGLDPSRLYITVFEGDENAPRDMEAVEIWKKYIPESRIYFLPAKNNWWSVGDNGPCGPDSEMFYDVTPDGLGDMTHEQYVAADDIGTVVEIWNDVFMQYEKQGGFVIGKLAQKNIDTGTGLERAVMVAQGKSNVYETDIFAPVMDIIRQYSQNYSERNARIVADHIRSALFLIGDGVTPSNKDQGYILRRIIRRAVLKMRMLILDGHLGNIIIDHYINFYSDVYPELNKTNVREIFKLEEDKFQKTIQGGLREFDKGFPERVDPFMLATTYGFPIEITQELAFERGIAIDLESFAAQMKTHQDTSRAGAAAKFKGGLVDTGEKTTQLHTAHHLLLAALQKVLGSDVHQRGSNITDERLRIDFSFDRKMTEEEKKKVEDQVNTWIQTNYTVCRREMPRVQAELLGAEMEFGAKYPDIVSVYVIEDENGNAISKEFCGGPHVEQTSGLGTFTIQKEEAVAAGIRRIKATLA